MQRNSDQDSGAGVGREEMLPGNTTKDPPKGASDSRANRMVNCHLNPVTPSSRELTIRPNTFGNETISTQLIICEQRIVVEIVLRSQSIVV